MSKIEIANSVDKGPLGDRFDEVLADDALAFVAKLHERFEPIRRDLIQRRAERQRRLQAGARLDFLEETGAVRDGDWVVAPAADSLQDRRVEITGPTERKMVINALNSGARGFMADFEDSNSPLWANMVAGHINLSDAIAGTIAHTAADGREYRLGDDVATLHVRPRGWHLPEKHMLVEGEAVAGALFDFGLHFFHNARGLIESGSGPYFYLPKMESHLEARLWNQVFEFAQEAIGLDRGTIKATVLIETVPAAFEMDEILYELREHAAGLNAGRWDYIFSMIKSFRSRSEFLLPDRSSVVMTAPFMRAYTELLVKTCHRRGAHAMGGMAAFIPSRSDPEANRRALAKLREDKSREAGDGFDGTWVAHPDSVAPATEEFDEILAARPNQIERQRPEVSVSSEDLLDVAATPGQITVDGLRDNVNVGIQYISSWLRGNGAAGIYGLMEDAATAEIARSQVWQWVKHGATTDSGDPVTEALVRQIELEELERIRAEVADDDWFRTEGRPEQSRSLFEQVALGPEFTEFLTLPAYEFLVDEIEGRAGQ